MITIKFFASLREQVGKGEIQLDIAAPLSVAQVWARACDNAPLPSHILMAINREYTSQDCLVHAGDEVAFFPPVTGG